MGLLSVDLATKRLQDVNNTQESIESISRWILHHTESIRVLTECWLNLFRSSAEEHRITLFYVLNDVVQRAKKKHCDSICVAFEQPAQSAVSIARSSEKLRSIMSRCLKLIAECKAFSTSTIEKMERIINDPMGETDDGNYEIDVIDLAKKIEAFTASVNFITKGLDTIKKTQIDYAVQIHTRMKDRKEGSILLRETNGAIARVERFREAVANNNRRVYELMDTVENAKRLFNMQLRDVAVVEDAYVKFGQGLREVQEEIEEMIRTNVYPAASPPRDAPSPSAEDDVFAGGVEQVLNKLRPHDVTDEADMDLEGDDEPPLPSYPPPWQKTSFTSQPPPQKHQSVVERAVALAAHMPSLASTMGIDPRARAHTAPSSSHAPNNSTGPTPPKQMHISTTTVPPSTTVPQQSTNPYASAPPPSAIPTVPPVATVPTPPTVTTAQPMNPPNAFNIPPPGYPPAMKPSAAAIANYLAIQPKALAALPVLTGQQQQSQQVQQQPLSIHLPPTAPPLQSTPQQPLISPYSTAPPGYGNGPGYGTAPPPPPPPQQSLQGPPPSMAGSQYVPLPSATQHQQHGSAGFGRPPPQYPPPAYGAPVPPQTYGSAGYGNASGQGAGYGNPPQVPYTPTAPAVQGAKFTAMPEFPNNSTLVSPTTTAPAGATGYFPMAATHQTPGSSTTSTNQKNAPTPYTPSAPGFRGRKGSDGTNNMGTPIRGGGYTNRGGAYGSDDSYQQRQYQPSEQDKYGNHQQGSYQQGGRGRGYGRGGGGGGYGRFQRGQRGRGGFGNNQGGGGYGGQGYGGNQGY